MLYKFKKKKQTTMTDKSRKKKNFFIDSTHMTIKFKRKAE